MKTFYFEDNEIPNKTQLKQFIESSNSPLKKAKFLATFLIKRFLIINNQLYTYNREINKYSVIKFENTNFLIDYLLMNARKLIDQSILTKDGRIETNPDLTLNLYQRYVQTSINKYSLTEDEKTMIFFHDYYRNNGNNLKLFLNMDFYKDIATDLYYLLSNNLNSVSHFTNCEFDFSFQITENE
jgi:hypothetical protein